MRRKPQEFKFEEEAAAERAKLVVRKEETLSLRYCLGVRPRLVAIDCDLVLSTTKPRMPRHKGKVERGVGYVKNSALLND